MVMRVLHCTVGLLVLALVSAAAAQAPPPAPRQASPDVTRFTVFLKGTPVGTVEVSVERGAEGVVISGTSRLGPPLALVVRNVEIRYDPDWKPIEYVLDAVVRDQTTRVRTTFAGGTAASDITQMDKSAKKTDAVAADTIVLPNAFYGAYEALAARLASAKAGTELRGYVVPQGEVAIKVIAVTDERIEAPGRSVATRHYRASFGSPVGPTEIDLWSDLSGRLVRFSVPTQSLDVVRADVATVAARREVAARPGDEIVRIPGNGFVLGATVSRPPGSPKTGTVKLPAVVLVAGSGSANRDETVANVPVFAGIAAALADAGFLVVRYDKRGTGDSGGRIEAAVISDYADDADAVVRYLGRRKDVDKKRIAMVAHSDGAWTALLAASRDSRIAALGLIGGAATAGSQLVLDMQQRALGRMSITDAEKQERIDLQRKIQKAVITGTGWEGIPPDMRKQADTPWFQSFLLFDPAKVMPRTKQPMLILRGALDTQVSAAEHEKLVTLARARKGPAGTAVQAGTLAGLNHILVPATTGEIDEYASLTDRSVGKELPDTLITWLKATFAGLGKK
jgi:hypothetical protein